MIKQNKQITFIITTILFLCGMKAAASFSTNLAVVGCGVLGTSLCKQVLQEETAADADVIQVVGVTKTTNHHNEILTDVGTDDRFSVATIEQVLKDGKKFRDVVFCAPPSGSEDYSADLKAAMELWDAEGQDGVFVFTSSSAVYKEQEGNLFTIVNETSPTLSVEESPRAARLLLAEDVCRENGGTVCRLGGLYTLDRGAHNFFMNKGEIARNSEGMLNLLHYDDAAGACLAALKTGSSIRKKTFLISDGSPVTRLGMCESCLLSKKYAGMPLPKFTGEEGDGGIGKMFDGRLSNHVLQWKPRYPSFETFMFSQR